MIEIKEKTVTGKTIRLHDADNVMIARIDLALGAKIEGVVSPGNQHGGLATNTPMFNRLSEDMDINCGEILDGTCSLREMGQRIFEREGEFRSHPAWRAAQGSPKGRRTGGRLL